MNKLVPATGLLWALLKSEVYDYDSNPQISRGLFLDPVANSRIRGKGATSVGDGQTTRVLEFMIFNVTVLYLILLCSIQ